MSEDRLSAARRLELTGVAEAGEHVEGHYRGVKVTLEDHGLERTLKFDLGVPVHWVSIGPHQDLNDPDVVQTGDADFDLAITILAVDGGEPTVRGYFDTTALRSAVRAFFERYPHATLRGRTLTVPRVAAQNPVTSECLDLGSKLMLGLREAIAASPVLPKEAPPVLSTTVTTEPAKFEPPDPRDALPPREDRQDFIVMSGFVVTLLGFVLLPRGLWIVSPLLGVATSGLMYWLARRRW